jgi:hypothetical protein
MAIPHAVGRFNKVVTNKVFVHLAGHGPFIELEHVGRHSGRVYRVPLNAFRTGDTVTFALTYGPRVDWLRNVRAVGGCRARIGREILTLVRRWICRPTSEWLGCRHRPESCFG